MATFLLIIIYIAFVSLGLPDALLGSAWPVMRADLGLPLDAAGVLTIVVTFGTIVSSLSCERVIARFGTSRVTAVSVFATAAALLGFSIAPSLVWLIVFSIPLGLGAGAVDAALNNYVALHYAARHMSWLHCFWGLGAFCGPTVMAMFLRGGGSWRGGYLTVGLLQVLVSVLLFAVMPAWRRVEKDDASRKKQQAESGEKPPAAHRGNVFKISGVPFALFTFFLYCSAEYCASVWSSSFFVETRGTSEAFAAQGASLFFVGITVGRLLTGFLTVKLSSEWLIRLGCLIILGGGALMLVPAGGLVPVVGLTLVGLGCAPVYPCMIHETPRRFGAQNSQRVIGWQMASAYTGSMLVPPVIGLLAGRVGIGILPVALVLMAVGLLVCSEMITRSVRRAQNKEQQQV